MLIVRYIIASVYVVRRTFLFESVMSQSVRLNAYYVIWLYVVAFFLFLGV